ncbi:alpha/beta hydrolase [Ktedonobacter sp. SOSP1-52]|uniref:alpha/beta hydrolase n=1 Tax=Ktedonobacter sp. SOSP1-52 TaxID=2778366 RepID=UPI00191522DE|nr:alpha/beta fold hydrolase [Ktedonobacter sp. SOSP1-52]GHO65033.1 alpha/beta hydrolase [Ktedonobacter sp. SOSP1-52]
MKLQRNAVSFSLGPQNTDRACVLVHNVGGSPLEMRDLGEYLAQQGIRVRGISLAGHDGDLEHLAQVEREAWLKTIAEEVMELEDYPYVFLGGFSVGSVLAILSALDFGQQIAGVIAMSTPMRLFQELSFPFGDYFAKHRQPLAGYALEDPCVRHDILTSIRLLDPKGVEELSEDEILEIALKEARYPGALWRQMTALVRELRVRLQELVTPLLIIQGKQDALNPPESASELYRKAVYAPKSLHWLERSGHFVMTDLEQEQLCFLCASFINDIVLHDRLSG